MLVFERLFWVLWIFILGAALGSFFITSIKRLWQGYSLIQPRSACPFCHHLLSWYQLIPILSYILLKARCSYCHHFIPFYYLAAEISTAFGLSVWAWILLKS